ncbi:hypothetical protein N9C00_02895 [Flavobacteriales bacterium]|nr:hypothetical protein [Flavobacteriales bacterium]
MAEGTKTEDSATHHTPDFYVDDSAMILGIRTMSNLTLGFIKTQNK